MSALQRDHMLAHKDGRVIVVGGPEEHSQLEEEGWEFKVYTPKKPKPDTSTPAWLERHVDPLGHDKKIREGRKAERGSQ